MWNVFRLSAKSALIGVLSVSLIQVNWVSAKDSNAIADAKVTVSKPKLSQPFRQLAKPLPQLTKARKAKLIESGEKIPGVDFVTEVPNRSHPLAQQIIRQNKSGSIDKVLQKSQASKAVQSSRPAPVGFGFEGMNNIQGVAPPDTNADVGPNHIVQMVNTSIGIWNKQGEVLLQPVAINSLWSGFGGLCETTNQGDPIVLYDALADRWLISQFAFNSSFTDNHQCIAISQTGDPTGAYYLYDFLWSNSKFNDYPHYGVWHDGYYAGVNQFVGNNYAGAGVVVYERDKMLTGQAARQIKFDLVNIQPDAFTPMPADIDGVYLPPTSMPQYFVSASGADDTIDVWNFTVDWSNPDNSKFEHLQSLAVAPYNGAVCGFDRNCVQQPNGQALDAVAQRMMFRLAYRNLNGTQHKLVANHTVIGSDTDSKIAGVRWYEIDVDNTTGAASIANQGTYNPKDGNSRWMASAAMDAVGNIGVGFSVSGATQMASLRMTGRYAGDPADTMTVTETDLMAATGSQSNINRWGDYSSLSVDPTDDCTMWFTSQYYKAENTNTTSWSTDIRSFKFDNCVAGPTGVISGVVSDASTNQPIENAEVSVGSFKVLSNAQGIYKLTLPVADDYQLTYYKYGWDAQSRANLDLTEDGLMEQNVSLSAATPITVSGRVSDGSGLGSSLYSEIIANVPGATISTLSDPVSGQYSLELFGGTLVKLSTSARDVGYIDESVDIDPAETNQQNFMLRIDQSCFAAGYRKIGFIEGFELGVPPKSWSVDDIAQSGSVWQSTTQTRGNLIGTSGNAAIVDSDLAGENVTTDSSLYSPVLTTADLPTLTLEFDSLYRNLDTEAFNLEISVNNGEWRNILKIPATNSAQHHALDLTAELNGAATFQLRWHYYNAIYAWYALIDNVIFTGSECNPENGVFVQGYVIDNNTQTALIGATVSSESGQVLSTATADDEQLPDAYFKLFIPAEDTQSVTVSHPAYASRTQSISGISLLTPIALDAGKVEIAAEQPIFSILQDSVKSNLVTISNIGKVAANSRLLVAELPTSGNLTNVPTGPFHASTRHFGPKALNELTTKKIRHSVDFLSRQIPLSSVDYVSHFSIPLTYAWGLGINHDTGHIWIGDVKLGGAAKDELHQFTPQGIATRKIIDTTTLSDEFAADVAYNNRTGMLWQVEAGNDNCIHELDPVNLVATGNKICPTFGVPQRGLTYDPLSNTFYSGSWIDSIIHQFDLQGTILRSINVELNISGLAFNPATGSLFVMSNDVAPAADVVVLDTNSETLAPITSFNFPTDIDLTGDGVADDSAPDEAQFGLALDCAGNLWTPVKDLGKAISITSGETNVCDWKALPWLSLNSGNTLTIGANGAEDIDIGFWSQDLEIGTYKAQLIVSSDTPYGDQSSLITLEVVEPIYGVLQFQASSIQAEEEKDLILSVERVDGLDLPVSVNFTTVDGTGIAGQDYTETAGVLLWGDQDIEAKTITIPVGTVDKNITFSVKLTTAQGATIGTNSSVSISVKDKPKGSGSFGLILMTLLIMAAGRRAVKSKK